MIKVDNLKDKTIDNHCVRWQVIEMLRAKKKLNLEVLTTLRYCNLFSTYPQI